MNSKGIGLFYALAAMASTSFNPTDRGTNNNKVLQGAPPQNPKKVIPKGCQEYEINGEKIIALSYKRALAKYKKRNKQLPS